MCWYKFCSATFAHLVTVKESGVFIRKSDRDFRTVKYATLERESDLPTEWSFTNEVRRRGGIVLSYSDPPEGFLNCDEIHNSYVIQTVDAGKAGRDVWALGYYGANQNGLNGSVALYVPSYLLAFGYCNWGGIKGCMFPNIETEQQRVYKNIMINWDNPPYEALTHMFPSISLRKKAFIAMGLVPDEFDSRVKFFMGCCLNKGFWGKELADLVKKDCTHLTKSQYERLTGEQGPRN